MAQLNRFDFEQYIFDCWSVTKDIDTIFEYMCETEGSEIDQDKVSNMLLGMKQLYDLRFNTLFDMFEELIKQKEL